MFNSKQKIFYIIFIIFALYIIKFPLFFKPNGKPREYGIGIDNEGYRKTLYTFQFAILIIAVILSITIKEK
jgi:hypothetical protein